MHVHACMYVCRNVCMYTKIEKYAFMYVIYIHACVCMYSGIHTETLMGAIDAKYVYIHPHMHECVCMHIRMLFLFRGGTRAGTARGTADQTHTTHVHTCPVTLADFFRITAKATNLCNFFSALVRALVTTMQFFEAVRKQPAHCDSFCAGHENGSPCVKHPIRHTRPHDPTRSSLGPHR